jgi:enediyne biosynthesis protein E4
LLYSGWGTRFVDVDNDGWRDLVVAQGHVLDTIEKSNPYLKYRQPPLLMLNTGKGFVNVSASAGTGFNISLNGRGAAFGDLNNDGQTDVVIAQLDGPPLLLRNNGTKNQWLGMKLVGSKSNRDGIGSRITVTDETGRKQIFDLNTAGSYLSSSDPRLIVGLGPNGTVKQVDVRWPSGNVQTVSRPSLNRYIEIKEDSQ